MKIAVWQALSTPCNIEENYQRLATVAKQAVEQGAELLVTPEMFITGYNIGDSAQSLAKQSPLEQVRHIARKYHIGLVVGGPEWYEPEAGAAHCFNAVHLIDDNGHLLARYHKTHLFGALDRDMFTAGDTLSPVVTYKGVKIAMMICYDVEFPENVRAAALAGAQLICVPTAQMQPFSHVNALLIPTRAWENQVYIAYANQQGLDGELEYVGKSVIAAPSSSVLAMAPDKGEALIYAEVDADIVMAAQEQNPYLSDLRQSLFRTE